MTNLTEIQRGCILLMELETPDADGCRPESFAAFITPKFHLGNPAMAGVRGYKARKGTNNSACSAQVSSPRLQGGLESSPGDGNADAEGLSMTTQSNATNPTSATVNFCGADILCLWHGDKPHVAVKPISDALGLDWSGQLQRIKRDPVLSTSVVVTPTQMPGDDQRREVVTLPLDKMNGWLFGVSARRVKPEVRDILIRYQEEAYDVLFRHFYGKAVQSTPATSTRTIPVKAGRAHLRRITNKTDTRQLQLPPPVMQTGTSVMLKDGRYLLVVRDNHVIGLHDVERCSLVDGGDETSLRTFLREFVPTAALPVALDIISRRIAIVVKHGPMGAAIPNSLKGTL